MTTRARPTVTRAFTLVELLVVLAIVVVLAGIVYTATAGVRRAHCLSNLRHISRALEMYRDDYAQAEWGSPEEMGLPSIKTTVLLDVDGTQAKTPAE